MPCMQPLGLKHRGEVLRTFLVLENCHGSLSSLLAAAVNIFYLARNYVSEF